MAPVKNVLILLTDQHRASATGYAGDSLAFTPHLDALASRSAAFGAAYTPSPVCVPARQSLITGRYPHAHGAVNNATPMRAGEVTLGHVAAAAGMATGAIGKMHFVGADRHHGFAERWDYEDYARAEPLAAGDAASGMAYQGRYGQRASGHALPTLPATNPLDRAYLAGPSPFPAAQHVESYITREAVRFLERHQHERFLLVCSYFKPHDPMTPPAEYWDLYAGRELPVPDARSTAGMPAAAARGRTVLGVDGFDDEAWRAAVRGYYGNLAFVDAEIGRVLAALAALGLEDDTLVVYTSDHGEFVGTRRHAGKMLFYDAAWRVPLLVAHAAAATPGRTTGALADLVDVFPTVAEAAGLPLPPRRHGVSLLPVARGEAPSVRDHVFAQLHRRDAELPYLAVRTDRWKLALYGPGEEQLFDLENDPQERTNLYAREPKRASELRGLMTANLALL